jgi:hypothetical protein
MIVALSLVVALYAGYAGWPWWVATAVGAGAGIWTFGVRAGGTPALNERTREASRALINGTLIAIVICGGLASGAYFVAQWLAG